MISIAAVATVKTVTAVTVASATAKVLKDKKIADENFEVEIEEVDESALRVLFLSSDTGGGHRASAESLANQFQLLYPGSKYYLLDVVGLNGVPPYNNLVWWYKHLSAHPNQWKIVYGISNTHAYEAMSDAHLKIMCERGIRKRIAAYKPHVVVSVHPLMNTVPALCCANIGNETGLHLPMFTVVTDLGSAHSSWFTTGPVESIFVGSDQIKNIALNRGKIRENKLEQIGLPIRHDFAAQAENMGHRVSESGIQYQQKLREQLKLPFINRDTILIMGGGEGVGSLSSIVDSIYCELVLRGVDAVLLVVCGRNEVLKKALEERNWNQPMLHAFFARREKRLRKKIRKERLGQMAIKAGETKENLQKLVITQKEIQAEQIKEIYSHLLNGHAKVKDILLDPNNNKKITDIKNNIVSFVQVVTNSPKLEKIECQQQQKEEKDHDNGCDNNDDDVNRERAYDNHQNDTSISKIRNGDNQQQMLSKVKDDEANEESLTAGKVTTEKSDKWSDKQKIADCMVTDTNEEGEQQQQEDNDKQNIANGSNNTQGQEEEKQQQPQQQQVNDAESSIIVSSVAEEDQNQAQHFVSDLPSRKHSSDTGGILMPANISTNQEKENKTDLPTEKEEQGTDILQQDRISLEEEGCENTTTAEEESSEEINLVYSGTEPGKVEVIGLGFVKNIAEYMVAADVLVSKAGPGTISEAAALSLPVLLTSFLPGQEEGNLDFVLENGFGSYVSDAEPIAIAETVCDWVSDRTKLEELSNNAKKCGTPYAARDIAERIGKSALRWKKINSDTIEEQKIREEQEKIEIEREKIRREEDNDGNTFVENDAGDKKVMPDADEDTAVTKSNTRNTVGNAWSKVKSLSSNIIYDNDGNTSVANDAGDKEVMLDADEDTAVTKANTRNTVGNAWSKVKTLSSNMIYIYDDDDDDNGNTFVENDAGDKEVMPGADEDTAATKSNTRNTVGNAWSKVKTLSTNMLYKNINDDDNVEGRSNPNDKKEADDE